MANEYDDILKEERAETLNASMYAGLQQQPDTEAQLQKLSERTGVPLEAVRLKRPEVEVQEKLANFDYEKVIKETPKLSAWLADPKNAALAHDDWENLSALERTFHSVADYPRALAGGLVGDAVGRTLSGAAELIEVGARAVDRPINYLTGTNPLETLVTAGGPNINPIQSLKATGKNIKTLGDWMKPPTERQNLGTDVAGGIGQIGGQIATHLLTGGLLTVPTMLAQGADVMAEKTAKDVADPALKDSAILAGGAITALTEKYGLDKILNRVPPEIKNRTLRFIADKVVAGGIEAGQEFTEGLMHDLARRTLTNADAELLEGVGREMSAAALSAAIVRTALGVKGHQRAKEQEQFVKSLTDTAATSKLRERMPERFKQYLDSVTAGGPVENIFVPADRFATYFQDAGLDPAVEASKLGVQNFAEAQLAGTDVVIPTSEFVTQLSGTDHLQGLWNDLRFNQAEMTLREAQEAQANRGDQQIDDETLARMTGAGAGDRTGFEEVKQQMLGELAGRFDSSTAEAYATQYAAAITTLAERAGTTPQELHARYDLRVNMPMPEGLRSMLDRVDIDLDPMLDRLRAGDIPSARRAFGASLSEFIREGGGLRESGESRHMDEAAERLPGQRKFARKDGMAIDMALEAAVEAGYFPGRDSQEMDDNDLLDALADDLNGNKIYSAHYAGDASANEMRGIRAMQEWLDALGADVTKMSNAEIRALIERSAAQDVGEVYDQAFPGEAERAQARILRKRAGRTQDSAKAADLNAQADALDALAAEKDAYAQTQPDAVGGATETTGRHRAPGPHNGVSVDQYAGHMEGDGLASDAESIAALQALAGKPDEMVTVYRAAPAGSAIRSGDWVSLSRQYAKDHGEATADGAGFEIIEQQVKASDLYTDGNSVNELGYQPEAVRSYNQAEEGAAGTTTDTASLAGEGDTARLPGAGGNVAQGVGMVQVPDVTAFATFGDFSIDGRNLLRAGEVIGDIKIEVEADAKTPHLVIRDIRINKKGEGAGTAAIKALADAAHGYGLPVALTSEAMLGKAHQKRLRAYYERIGFVKNSGPLKNKAIREEFVLTPPVGKTLYQNTGNKRGSITISPDGRMRISLFEKANLSTFLHETGHFYLEVLGDLASQEGAAPQLVEDYATIKKWMGIEDGGAIEVKHHEMFARANEAYLMTGKAPNPELQGIFRRFRDWLKQIYKTVAALDVPMSPEIHGVFDRIYATDEQIEAAQQEGIYTEAFATAADAGMTEAEFQAYRSTVAQTIEQGQERLQTKLMNELTRERTAQWKAERERMQEAVEAEVDAEPVYAAFKALKDGALEDGTPIKLSRDDLVRLYGKEFLKRMPRGFQRIYQAEGGVDVETAAEIFGFDNGRALVDQLVNMQPRDALVESITDQRMKEMFGDIRFDGSIADEANRALHNDKREDMLKIELRAIRRKAAEVAPLIRARDQAVAQEQQAGEQFVADALPQTERTGRTKDGREYTYMAFDPAPMKRAAAGIIGQKAVRDVRPMTYLLAERDAAKQFAKAMKAGDYMTAAEQKQRELFNHYLYKEATARVDRTEKRAAWLRDQGGAKKRQALGKAGADYLEQVDEILERYEFKTVPLNKLDRRQSLAAWVSQQEAAGIPISVPEDVLNEARRVNWKQLSVDEFDAVYDTVRNITHVARWKNKLITEKRRRDFDDLKGEFISAIENSGMQPTQDALYANAREQSTVDKLRKKFRQVDAALMKTEQLMRWFDGGDNGPWSREFFDLAAEAQTKEYDLHRAVTLALNKVRESMPNDWRGSLGDKVPFTLPMGGGKAQMSVTRYTMLSVALNMGNEQNIQRLRDGNQMTDDNLRQIREAMTDADWQFVQGVWDTVETLWPDIAALEKRTTGLVPPKVEAQSFDVRGKSYRGGYFPIVYDPAHSKVGEKQMDTDQSIEAFLSAGVGRPTTSKGHTKARAENVQSPLLLDMNDVLGAHLYKVVKDISHREAVSAMYRVLQDPEIKQAISERMGFEYYKETKNWVLALVSDGPSPLTTNVFTRFASAARTNLAIAVMGWKFTTSFSQLAGFGPSRDLVKGRFLSKAAGRFLASPRATSAFAMEKSGEMRNRVQTLDRDVRDSMRRLAGETSLIADVQRTAFVMTALADKAVTVPTWIGAYDQALSEGKSEADAISLADSAVRMSQGGGGAKDLAAVQRSNEFMKLVTMFYTPFSALYARLRDVQHQTAVQGIGYLPTAVARVWWLAILPAVLGEVLAGRGPDEDEDEVEWAVRKALMYPISTIPLVRDMAGLVEAQMVKVTGGEMEFQPTYQLSPITSAIGKAWRTIVANPLAVAQGDKEPSADMAWGAVESAGFVFGLPTAQVSITGSYLLDLMTGDAQPENAPEVVRNLMFRRPKE